MAINTSSWATLVLLVVFAIAVNAEAQGTDFEKEIACYQTLAVSSQARDYRVGDKAVLVPYTRDGKAGYYLYTSGQSHFCELPQKGWSPNDKKDVVKAEQFMPNSPEPDFNKKIYWIKLTATERPMYLYYEKSLDDKFRDQILAKEVPPYNADQYHPAGSACSQVASEESEKYLESEIKMRIAKVSEFFSKNSSHEETPGRVFAALEKCGQISQFANSVRSEKTAIEKAILDQQRRAEQQDLREVKSK